MCDGVNGGLSKGSSMCRPGSKNTHLYHWTFLNKSFGEEKLKNVELASSVKPPRRRGVFGLNTPRQGGGGRGVFKPNTPLTSQGKVVLQFILRPPGSIWRAGDGI